MNPTFLKGAIGGAIGAAVAAGLGAWWKVNVFIISGSAAWIAVVIVYVLNHLWKNRYQELEGIE